MKMCHDSYDSYWYQTFALSFESQYLDVDVFSIPSC